MLKYLLKKAVKFPSISIRSDKCIRYRNKKNLCSRCIDICSFNSIHEKDGKLAIEQDKCIKCGSCYGGCPSNAIEVKNFIDFDYKDKCLNKETYFIACSESKESGFDNRVSCLNMLRPEDIIILSLYTLEAELVFCKFECEHCNKYSEAYLFEKSFNKAFDFLKECGFDVKTKMLLSKEELRGCKKDIDGEISRSDFIRFSQKQIDFLFKDIFKEAFSLKEALTNENIRANIAKIVLKNNSTKKTILSSNNGLFWNLKTSPRCTGCGVCQAICPWEAWSIKENSAIHSLKNCRACGLCRDTCPSQAIIKNAFSVEKLRCLIE